GSSVAAENEADRLAAAATFAYAAKLPMYVFHCQAGVFGKQRFEDTPGIKDFGRIVRLLPADLPNWQRNDGKEATAPFTAFAAGQPNRYWPEVKSSTDGCVRNTGSQRGQRFVCVPIGIRSGGLKLEARRRMKLTVYDLVTGKPLLSSSKERGE